MSTIQKPNRPGALPGQADGVPLSIENARWSHLKLGVIDHQPIFKVSDVPNLDGTPWTLIWDGDNPRDNGLPCVLELRFNHKASLIDADDLVVTFDDDAYDPAGLSPAPEVDSEYGGVVVYRFPFTALETAPRTWTFTATGPTLPDGEYDFSYRLVATDTEYLKRDLSNQTNRVLFETGITFTK
jgi:hypothetical protein